VNRRGEGIILDVLLGVVGAVIGGGYQPIRPGRVSGLNLVQACWLPVIGAVVVFWVSRAFDARVASLFPVSVRIGANPARMPESGGKVADDNRQKKHRTKV